jgi:hypothetical protein
MAGWKKVIVSGSQAELLNLKIDQEVNVLGDISGSNLQLSGDANISGDINLGGNITIGDASSDTVNLGAEVVSNVIPAANNAYDLGSSTKRWDNIYANDIDATSVSGDGSGLTNINVAMVATVANAFVSQTSVAVNHNFNSKNVTVTVYDDTDTLIIPSSVTLSSDNTATVTFDSSTSGNIVVAKGGHIVSGSTGWNFISNKPSELVSSSIAGDAQGQIKINGTNINVPTLQQSSSPQFAGLTITGDLVVEGDVTAINTTNLLVEDKFILLNSGSGAPDQGGIVIDEGNGQGHAFIYNDTAARFGYTGSLAHNAASATPDAYAGAVVDIDAGHTDIPEYQKNGNVKIDSGTVFIYA